MSDKVVFKGQVYGNTVATKMSVILEEPQPIDDDGTYIYVKDGGTDTQTVEIAQGGRATYGSTDLDTVVCQGIKMKKGLNSSSSASSFLDSAFVKGEIKPTDLYTSFTLPICFTSKPEGWKVKKSGEEAKAWDGSYKVIAEDYRIIGTHVQGSNTYLATITSDLPVDMECAINHQSSLVPPQNPTNFKSIYLGKNDTTPSWPYQYMPKVYNRLVEAGSNNDFPIQNGVNTYVGILFSVEDIVRVDANTLWTQQLNAENEYIFATTDVEGYAKIRPCVVKMQKRTNELRAYCPTSQSLPTRTGTCPIYDGYIVSIRTNDGRTFYTWHSNLNEFKPFALSDLASVDYIYYCGDAEALTTTGTVNIIGFESSNTIEGIFNEMLGDKVTLYSDSSMFRQGDFVIKSNSSNIALGCYISYQTNNSLPFYVQEGTDIFYHYILNGVNVNQYESYCPFKNNAEVDFALGVREELQYITEDEYRRHVNGGETNE